VLAWHDEFPDAVLQLKRPGGPLVVTSGERAVLQLATYEGERYELEARLSQTPWVGGVGVFVQGREEIHGGERTVTADYLLIDLKNPATPQLYRGPLSAFPAARRARVDYVKTYPFLAPTTGEHTLTLTVGPGGPEALTWDGDEAVTGLRAPVLGLDPRAGAAGAVGLVVQNCTVSVRSIRLRPLK
jgi:hypothetical protein